jgi:diacylglycerol kinase family enzyme
VTSRTPAVVVLNPSAHGGSGVRRFEDVRPLVESSFAARIVIGRPDGAWQTEVRAALEQGVRAFIAAGGDGTAHELLGVLASTPHRPPLETLVLGAVGLGSSNDLHKPVRRYVGRIPVLLDMAQAKPRDIVRCTYTDSSTARDALVLVSASLGLVACANARFRRSTATVRLLRRLSTTAAIAWASASTLASWHNLPARLRIDDGASSKIALSSFGVLKTEWLSGRLRFGHPVGPASGDFDVVLAVGLGRVRLLFDMLALLHGHFDGRPGHRRQRARSLAIWLDRDVPLELDGEIVRAREIHFDMFPERIMLCA